MLAGTLAAVAAQGTGISGLGDYILTLLRLVTGALTLDPVVFQAAFDYQGPLTFLPFWIVFVAGLSRTLGQSSVLFANRVKPGRFAVSLILGALEFLLQVILLIVVVWAMVNLLGEKPWSFYDIARAVSLTSAPYWLAILILIPTAGPHIERLLKLYVLLVLIACIQTVFDLTFFGAVLGGVVAGLISQGLTTLLGRALSPLAAWITKTLFGPEALTSTREIYDMFAARNQVVQ
jgi:hypothetical protein